MLHLIRRPATWPGLLLVLAGLGSFLVAHIAAPPYEARLRAQGWPSSIEDLNAWYPEPEPKSADTYQMAFASAVNARAGISPEDYDRTEFVLQAPIIGKGRWPETVEELPQAYVPVLEKYLADHARALEVGCQAASLGPARFAIDLKMTFAVSLDHLGELQGLGRLLAANTLMQARAGDAEAATESMLCGLRMASALENEPVIVSQLARSRMLSTAVKATELAINGVPLTDGQLLRVQELLGSPSWQSGLGLERAFQNEFIGLLHTLKATDWFNNDDLGSSAGVRIAQHLLGLGGYDQLAAVDYFQRLVEEVRAPHPFVQEMPDWSEREIPMLRAPMALVLFTALGRTESGVGAMAAYAAVGEAGVAVRRFCLAEGRAPQSLEELVPGYLENVPTDPFSGTPVHLAFLAEGVAVYSIGRDREDDGGAPRGYASRHYQPPAPDADERGLSEQFGDIRFLVRTCR
jgi:hypothetical protein